MSYKYMNLHVILCKFTFIVIYNIFLYICIFIRIIVLSFTSLKIKLDNWRTKMKDEDIYPTLAEQGKEEAQELMNEFKEKMLKLSEGILNDLYIDVTSYVESDHWQNYRNKIMRGLCDYTEQRKHSFYNFKELRKAILAEHRELLVEDLNSDLLEEVADLKRKIEWMENKNETV